MTYRVEPERPLLYDSLGPRLRELRERDGVSVRRAAKRAGISRASWSATEAGTSTPSVAIAERMACALNSTLPELLAPPLSAEAEYALRRLADEFAAALDADQERADEVEGRSRRGEGVFMTAEGAAVVMRIGDPERIEDSLAVAAMTRDSLRPPP